MPSLLLLSIVNSSTIVTINLVIAIVLLNCVPWIPGQDMSYICLCKMASHYV